ncbi:MAG TPA: hypothetical protein VM286_05805 [Candidatus Thermoplasmatota archaeon]|nr:hypothetical protein [Candidatus Thermoplasmatota archaeon]
MPRRVTSPSAQPRATPPPAGEESPWWSDVALFPRGVWCVWCAVPETFADHRRLHPGCEDCPEWLPGGPRMPCWTPVRTFDRPQHHTAHAGLPGLFD